MTCYDPTEGLSAPRGLPVRTTVRMGTNHYPYNPLMRPGARPVPQAIDPEVAWEEGFLAASEWISANPPPSGVWSDPPRNPYEVVDSPEDQEPA